MVFGYLIGKKRNFNKLILQLSAIVILPQSQHLIFSKPSSNYNLYFLWCDRFLYLYRHLLHRARVDTILANARHTYTFHFLLGLTKKDFATKSEKESSIRNGLILVGWLEDEGILS